MLRRSGPSGLKSLGRSKRMGDGPAGSRRPSRPAVALRAAPGSADRLRPALRARPARVLRLRRRDPRAPGGSADAAAGAAREPPALRGDAAACLREAGGSAALPPLRGPLLAGALRGLRGRAPRAAGRDPAHHALPDLEPLALHGPELRA